MNKKNIITDTYAEAFTGIYSRIILTADDEKILNQAAEDSTSTPSVVIGRVEGGIEKWLGKTKTPDNRRGVILQFWGALQSSKSVSYSLDKFETELSYRIRQDILVKPFTAVFNALSKPEGKMDMMIRIGHCGDGYEWIENRYGKEIIIVPLMVPDFVIERYLGYSRGIMGANFWIMCETKKAVNQAGKKALNAIRKIDGVITPFDVCSAGSKPETSFPLIGPTTNHPYCFSLKKKLGSKSLIPKNVKYIPEIVINGVSLEAVKKAMKNGIEAASQVEGVIGISAGNYGGKLGKYKIELTELFS
jgi:formylmethanofuran--tetrahydromethanopterin N-formyltransferase